MRKISWIAGVSVLVCAVASGGQLRAVKPDKVPNNHKKIGALRTPNNLFRNQARIRAEQVHAWLMSEQVAKGLEDPLEVTLTAEELAEINTGECL